MSDWQGKQSRASDVGDLDRLNFVFNRLAAQMATATLVRVESVTNAGELAPVGRVDIRPLVAQMDGAGEAVPHGVIHDVPYARIQGGANAVIVDPQVGDIGIAVFASRDISSVKNNKGPSNPGSRRRFDMADALYVGGVLNSTPSQYVRFSSDGIEIKSATIKLIGNVQVTGTVTATGEIQAIGKNLSTHIHTGVTSGAGNSGPPA